MRIAEVFNVSADHVLFDDVARRPLHAAEDVLGDRLAVIGELSPDDLASLLNVVDGLVAKSRMRAMAGDWGDAGVVADAAKTGYCEVGSSAFLTSMSSWSRQHNLDLIRCGFSSRSLEGLGRTKLSDNRRGSP
ncbi:MAG: hypothetical protein ABR511_03415 [Acidimicrobiales bacterium]